MMFKLHKAQEPLDLEYYRVRGIIPSKEIVPSRHKEPLEVEEKEKNF